MSKTTTIDRPTVDPVKDGPAIAHYYFAKTGTALCGAAVIGYPVPPNYPHICAECKRLFDSGTFR